MELGLSSYTYGWAVGVAGHLPSRPLDEQGLLDRCQEQGVQVLQIGDNLPVDTFSPERLARLAERAARDNVRLEIGARGLHVAQLRRYVELARKVGAKLLRFVIDGPDYHPTPALVTTVLREADWILEDLVLGIENHDRFSAATVRAMIEDIGSSRVGVCLDTANSLGAGEGIETVLASLAPVVVNLHIKDFTIQRVPHQMGFIVSGRPAGSGMLDLRALLPRLTATGRCDTAILELWTPPEPELADTIAKEARWAVESMEYLRQFFPSSGS